MTTFTTKAADAAALVSAWYAMVPDVAAQSTPKDTAWWVKQIQQDGSHTAFLNFANGIAQQHGPAAANELTQAVATQTKQTGLPPWTPATGAVNGQLPGTNTKSGAASVGSALTSPVGKAIEDVVAGVLDVATAGVATPFTTAGLALAQGGGAALQPGANIGDIAKGAIGGAGTGAALGAGANLLNGATGGALTAGGSATGTLPTAPVSTAPSAGITWDADGNPVLPGTSTQDIGNASAQGGTGDPSGSLPSIPGAAKTAATLGAATGALPTSPTSTNPGGILGAIQGITGAPNIGTSALEAALLANAASLGGQSTDQAQAALKTAQDAYDAKAPLRAAGIAGMLNPQGPDLSNLQKIATTGNPFAVAGTLPGAPSPTAPLVQPPLPLGASGPPGASGLLPNQPVSTVGGNVMPGGTEGPNTVPGSGAPIQGALPNAPISVRPVTPVGGGMY